MSICLKNIIISYHIFLSCSPGEVAAHRHVASDHGARKKIVINGVWDYRGRHGELHGGGVDDANHVAGPGRVDDAEERALEAVFGVELNHLLVVVGALKELDSGVEGTAVGLEEHLDGLYDRRERVCSKRAALDGRRVGDTLLRRKVHVVGHHLGGKRELELSDIANGHRVRSARGINRGAEGSHLAVLDIHAHLVRGVVGSIPELDVGVERTPFGREDDLHLLHVGGTVRPGAEGAALNDHRRRRHRMRGLGGRCAAQNVVRCLARNIKVLRILQHGRRGLTVWSGRRKRDNAGVSKICGKKERYETGLHNKYIYRFLFKPL